jgi:hypothetical protein
MVVLLQVLAQVINMLEVSAAVILYLIRLQQLVVVVEVLLVNLH